MRPFTEHSDNLIHVEDKQVRTRLKPLAMNNSTSPSVAPITLRNVMKM